MHKHSPRFFCPVDRSSSTGSSGHAVPASTALPGSALDFVRRQARRLLKAARSEQPMHALPALRRLQAAGLFSGWRLPELFRQRETVQLKHVLRALAMEAGHPDWAGYKQALEPLPAQALDDYLVEESRACGLSPWFSNEAEAREHARSHGGRVIRYRGQAVVVPQEQLPGPGGGAIG
ncbi:hypothetical protein [Eleftheria terrae]|uniref:hypothetical protein n=1 Tax=Eleftheria terrae TaxID=1597781 RepID=UPI00263A7D24|nr:hypothetical protein [Eleftheria terrae]WKB51701.1 hypothetical protein N7L95_18130 [Eleftheria terrae]